MTNLATLAQAQQVLGLMAQKKVSADRLQQLLLSGRLADLLDGNLDFSSREAFRGLLGLNEQGRRIPDPKSIRELVGVSIPGEEVSLNDRIVAGNYTNVDAYITSRSFRLTIPAGPRRLFLADFDTTLYGYQLQAWAWARGYDLPVIDDILALGSNPTYQGLQCWSPICATGSCIKIEKSSCVPFIGGSKIECQGVNNRITRTLKLDLYGLDNTPRSGTFLLAALNHKVV